MPKKIMCEEPEFVIYIIRNRYSLYLFRLVLLKFGIEKEAYFLNSSFPLLYSIILIYHPASRLVL